MIWWMNTHTLMKKFTKRSDEEVQNTNFLILSSKVNCTNLSNNVLNVYNAFLCVNTLKGVGLMDEPNSKEALAGFTKFLLNSPTLMQFIATVIQTDLSGTEDIVFLTTKEEADIFGMDTFTDAIFNLFGYRINEYPDNPEYSRVDVLNRLIYYLEESENALIGMMTNDKKLEVLSKKSKKEQRHMVEDDPRYISGMRRDDIVELICSRESRWGNASLGSRQIFNPGSGTI